MVAGQAAGWQLPQVLDGARPTGASPVLRPQEMALSGQELPGTVESVEEALKRHRDFLTTMELNQQKMQLAVQAAEGLLRQGNTYGEQAQEAVTRLLEK